MQRNNFPLFSILLLAAVFAFSSCKSSQKTIVANPPTEVIASSRPITDPVQAAALSAILPAYTQWETAELNGKLHLSKLPVSPTIRVYMKNREEISISVRVALLGEVGRVDVNQDSITAVNKMKRVYCTESIAGVKYDYPDIIGDVQSLLLGRVVVLNAGELRAENSDLLDFKELESASGSWSLTYPKGRSELDEFGYEYKISPDGLTQMLALALSTADTDMSLNLDYSYPGNGCDLNISFTRDGSKKFSAEVDFDNVKWGANPPSALNLNSRYSKVSIKQFLKSF